MARNPLAFRQVALLTAIELFRQPICLLLCTSTVAFIALLPVLLTHNLGESGKLVRDSALALIFLGALLLSAAAACGAVRNEMGGGTAASVLSKPIGRGRFLLAKFVGVSCIMLWFVWISSLSVLMAERVAETPALTLKLIGLQTGILAASYLFAAYRNFKFRVSFPATALIALGIFLTLGFIISLGVHPTQYIDPAGHGHEHGEAVAAATTLRSPQRWTLLPACGLLAMAALMLQALALFCATRLRIVPTLTICTLFFLLGLMSDYLFAGATEPSFIASTIYTLLPNWQHFWMADALTGGGSIPWHYVAQTALYSFTWIGGVLLLAIGSFQRMEVK